MKVVIVIDAIVTDGCGLVSGLWREVDLPIVPRIGDWIGGCRLLNNTVAQVSGVDLFIDSDLIIVSVGHCYDDLLRHGDITSGWSDGRPAGIPAEYEAMNG